MFPYRGKQYSTCHFRGYIWRSICQVQRKELMTWWWNKQHHPSLSFLQSAPLYFSPPPPPVLPVTSRRAWRLPNAGEFVANEILSCSAVCEGGNDAQVGVEGGCGGGEVYEWSGTSFLVIRLRSSLLSRKPVTEIRLCRWWCSTSSPTPPPSPCLVVISILPAMSPCSLRQRVIKL